MDIVVEITGSYRRGKPTSHDVDLLVTYRDYRCVMGTLKKILNELERRTELAHLTMGEHDNVSGER